MTPKLTDTQRQRIRELAVSIKTTESTFGADPIAYREAVITKALYLLAPVLIEEGRQRGLEEAAQACERISDSVCAEEVRALKKGKTP